MNSEYDDIIELPHHQSSRRRHMPLSDRAAQFAPFAALTGFEDCIEEKGRITESAGQSSSSCQAIQLP